MKAIVSERLRKILSDPKSKKEFFAEALCGKEEVFTVTYKNGNKESFKMTKHKH